MYWPLTTPTCLRRCSAGRGLGGLATCISQGAARAWVAAPTSWLLVVQPQWLASSCRSVVICFQVYCRRHSSARCFNCKAVEEGGHLCYGSCHCCNKGQHPPEVAKGISKHPCMPVDRGGCAALVAQLCEWPYCCCA